MDDDFFADLLPSKPAPPALLSAPQNDFTLPDMAPSRSFSQQQHEPIGQPLFSTTPQPFLAEQPAKQPNNFDAGNSKQELRSIEQLVASTVENSLKRFAGNLQRVLEDINRRLQSLENQTENLGQVLADVRKVSEVKDDTLKERFGQLERSLREVHRSVQLIRDKQELAEAQAELAAISAQSGGEKKDVSKGLQKELPASHADDTLQESQAAQPRPTAPPAPVARSPVQAVPDSHSAPTPLPAPTQQAQSAPVYSAPQQSPQQAYANQAEMPQQPRYAPAPAHPSAPEQQQVQFAPPPTHVPQPPPPPQPPQQYQQPHQALQPPQQPQYSAPQLQPSLSLPAPPPVQHTPPPPSFHPYPAQPPSPYGGSRPHYPAAPSQLPPPAFQHGSSTPVQQGNWGGAQAPLPNPGLPGSFAGRPPPPAPQPPAGGAQSAAPQTRSVPLEKVIDDVASMGFSRHEVRAVVTRLMESGVSVDLNVVLDRLMKGGR